MLLWHSPEESFSSLSISLALKKYINDFTILIYGSPMIPLFTINLDKNLINEKCIPVPTKTRLNETRQCNKPAHVLRMSIGQMFGIWPNLAPSLQRLSLHLRQSKPSASQPVGKYEKFLVFDSDFDGVQFPSSWGEIRLEPDPAILREYFQQRIHRLEHLYPNRLPSKIQRLLTHALPSGEYSLKQIAQNLDLHPRVLQKRLKSEDTSFSKLLEETRLNIARQQLRNSEVTITDLALRLGYSDVSVFSRHFKRWTGDSPSQWRRSGQ